MNYKILNSQKAITNEKCETNRTQRLSSHGGIVQCYSNMCFVRSHRNNTLYPRRIKEAFELAKHELTQESESSDKSNSLDKKAACVNLNNEPRSRKCLEVRPVIFHMDSAFFVCFLNELRKFQSFRNKFIRNFHPVFNNVSSEDMENAVTVVVVMTSPVQEMIDELG